MYFKKSLWTLSSDKKAGKSGAAEEAAANDNNGFFTDNAKINFSNVKVEPLFEEDVDFDIFIKSDFRAVKVKECVAVPKSKKLLYKMSRPNVQKILYKNVQLVCLF